MLRTHYLTMKDIGSLAQERRYGMGLKQKAVADMMGVTQQAVSAFERGESKSLDLFLWYLNHGAFDNLDSAVLDDLK